MAQFYVIRHAETQFNRNGRYQGSRSDQPLSVSGRHDAIDLSKNIDPSWFHHPVFSSPMRRAAETAALLAAGRAEIFECADLCEYDAGRWTDKFIEDIDTIWPEMRMSWNMGVLPSVPDGDRAADFGRRIWAGLQRCADIVGDRNAVIVTHAGVIRQAHQLIEGDPFTPKPLGAIVAIRDRHNWRVSSRTEGEGGSE